ncbi:glycoside hydrolase family 28 protein [Pedobacter sp. LMG 31464]|uniref:Glycoside hydrolase family 28 protein n=1 Tax=Pedobacter planticolens TaxID=2679964 RepID=A0A923DV69_9SPHI|nr:glycoside hydrolase family 28 protein [Pedobacter planticolens]MBB2144516.1 glycoside hydrolase family 28 protein [Pedobacter planticolens]
MKKIGYTIFAFLIFNASFFANAQSGVKTIYSFDNLPVIAKTSFKTDTFTIVKYGAKSDGLTLNTKAINDAIIACNKKGGGVVLIPKGLWLSGPIELKSNVNLHLQKNAILQFTKDFDQYPLVASNWEGLPQMRNQSPLWATNQQNIAITGFGIIDGAGEAWRMVKKDKLTESQWKKLTASGGLTSEDKKTWYPSEKTFNGAKLKNPGEITSDKTPEFYTSIKDFLRPNLLVLTSCKKILLEGVTFQNSPAWNLHPLMCEDLTVRNVYVKNPWYAQNGDGIDIESCKNVLIEGSTFDVGDDGICIKSGRDAAGRKRGMPTENVIIRNSTVYHAHGGFVIGSEMSGGARNIFVSDCSFIGTDIGLRFKTTRGRGGVVEKIFVKNINMKDIVGEAVLFDMYYAAVDPVPLTGEKRDAPKIQLLPVTEETPVFKDFHISNMVCDGAAKAIFIRGLPELSISNITIDNFSVKATEGIDIQEAKNISLSQINLVVDKANPLINIQNGNNINFTTINYNTAQLLFRISGDRNSAIKTSGLDASKATNKTEFLAGATEKSVQINK